MERSIDNDRARSMARRNAARKRRAAKRRRVILSVLCVLLSAILAVCVIGIIILQRSVPLVDELTVEAGSMVAVDRFLTQAGSAISQSVSFKTDMAGIDMSVEGDHVIELYVDGKVCTSILHVRDTVAPKAEPVEMTIDAGMLPAPELLVTNVRDVGAVTVSYQETPDVSQGGEVIAKVLLTDAAGNTSVVRVKLTVIFDKVPPVIEGAVDRKFYVGDPIIYTGAYEDFDDVGYVEVRAYDETSTVTLTVDRDALDTTRAGVYPVTYTATDAVGNVTSVTVEFTLVDKPEGYVEPEVVYDLARQVLDSITTEDMSDMEVAFAIYRWVTTHIAYVGTSDKSSWTGGAYQAFTEYSGDCFNYFAAAKALYDVAGIENVDVVKSDTSHSSHYWSLIDLGYGWYHVDCTPRIDTGHFFMNTDAELEAYSVQNRNSHVFDGSLYPERATESVQDKVDYVNGKIIE